MSLTCTVGSLFNRQHNALDKVISSVKATKFPGYHHLAIMTSNDPLHGKTLEMILNELVKNYGWKDLANRININCFKTDPSIKSCLTFLRKNEWARKKVENLYIVMLTRRNSS